MTSLLTDDTMNTENDDQKCISALYVEYRAIGLVIFG